MTASARRHLLVVGGDIGGTATRIVVVDGEGRVRSRATTGGGNPVSHPGTAATAFGDALGQAMAGVDPGAIRGAVVGVAGGGALQVPAVRQEFDQAWAGAGLTVAPDYRSDLEVAFAAGRAEPDGRVLIAGTGAVAGTIRGRRLVHTADGHGWLLGDDGSGFWVGRAACRAALRELDEPGETGLLTGSVLRELLGEHSEQDLRGMRGRVIHAVHSRPPVRLAELAPLVWVAHRDGDPAAGSIVDEAARLLAATLGRLDHLGPAGPVVLAGSLARPECPVGAKLRELLVGRTVVVTARDEVAGAAWLALDASGAGLATDAGVRARLFGVASDRE